MPKVAIIVGTRPEAIKMAPIAIEARKRRGVKPVLILTARGNWDERVEGIDAGADDYLPKPFNPRELLARIRAVMREASRRGIERVDQLERAAPQCIAGIARHEISQHHDTGIGKGFALRYPKQDSIPPCRCRKATQTGVQHHVSSQSSGA